MTTNSTSRPLYKTNKEIPKMEFLNIDTRTIINSSITTAPLNHNKIIPISKIHTIKKYFGNKNHSVWIFQLESSRIGKYSQYSVWNFLFLGFAVVNFIYCTYGRTWTFFYLHVPEITLFKLLVTRETVKNS